MMRLRPTRVVGAIVFKAAWSVVGVIAVLFLAKSFQKKAHNAIAAKNAASAHAVSSGLR